MHHAIRDFLTESSFSEFKHLSSKTSGTYNIGVVVLGGGRGRDADTQIPWVCLIVILI